MASSLVDLVKINITSTGTGPIKLGTAAAGFRGVEALINGRDYSYSIQQGKNWEVGRGTFLSATAQLVRSVLYSSNGGTAIAIKTGAQVAFVPVSEDLDAVQLAADVTAAAAQAASDAATSTNAAATASSQAAIATTQASLALTAGSTGNPYPNAYASTLPKGVTSGTIGGTAITGATPGTYALTPTGGSITGVQANLVVLTATTARIDIINTGLGTGTTPPTWDKPSGATLPAGTTLTAVVSTLIPDQKSYWVASADGSQILQYGNNAGSVATYPFGGTQTALRTYAGIAALESATSGYSLASATLDVGAYYNRTTGARVVNALYQNLTYNVLAGERGYRATGTLGGGSVASLAIFYSGTNASGSVLGYQSLPDGANHINEVLTVPTGTASIVINGTVAGLALRLERLMPIDGITLTQQGFAAVRAQTRQALQAAGTVPADFGNQATVFGYNVSGDCKPVRYVRGSGCFPTSNGWGIDPTETSLPALAFGIISPKDDTVDSATNALDIYRTPTQSRAAEDINDTIVTMPSSGLFVPKGIDWDKLFYVDLANAATLEVDLSHLPLAKTYSFCAVYESNTGRVVFDAGYGATFVDTGTRFLSVTAGTKLQIQRRSVSQIVIVSWSQFGGNAAPTGIAQGSYSPTVRTTSAFVAGQSLVQQGYGYGASHGAFCARLAALTGPASVHIVNAAYGGSGICERDADPATPTNYWVDMTTPGSPADGPNLTAAMAIISSKNGDSSQPAYGFAIIDHGQQSSYYVDAPGAANANFTKAMYKTATQYMISRLRTAAGSGTLKIGLRTLGRRSSWPSTVTGRMQVIRDAQLEMIAADSNLFLAGETYDLELRDAVHPTDTGYDIVGYRDADEVAKVVYAKTGMVNHPTIISATLNTTFNYVDVLIRTGNYSGSNIDRIFMVPDPRGFAVFNSGGAALNVVKSFWTVADTSNPNYQQCTLRLFLDGAASGGTLYYVWDSFLGFDPQRPIRTTQGSDGKALRPAKVSL